MAGGTAIGRGYVVQDVGSYLYVPTCPTRTAIAMAGEPIIVSKTAGPSLDGAPTGIIKAIFIDGVFDTRSLVPCPTQQLENQNRRRTQDVKMKEIKDERQSKGQVDSWRDF